MTKKYTTHYLTPESLNTAALSEKAKGVIHNYKEYHLMYILDLIYGAKARNRNNEGNEYTPLCGHYLKNRIRNYREYLGFLQEEKVIQSDYYVPGEKCYGYMYLPTYQMKAKVITLEVNKPNRPRLDIRPCLNKTVNDAVHPLSSFFNPEMLKIEYNQALGVTYGMLHFKINGRRPLDRKRVSGGKLITLNPIEQYNSSLHSITSINQGNHYFSIDNRGYRLHTNLTNMKSIYRNFLTYNGKPLVGIDLKNSQPYLCSVLFQGTFWRKNSKFNIYNPYLQDSLDDIVEYCKTIDHSVFMIRKSNSMSDLNVYLSMVSSGVFYEQFGERIQERLGAELSRDEIKTIMFQNFFTANQFIGQKSAAPKKLFKQLFPTVYQAFTKIKKNDKSRLPILLQRIESALFLGIVAPELRKRHPTLPLFTIHDSFLVPAGWEHTVAKIMTELLEEYTRLKPTVAIEYYYPKKAWIEVNKVA